MDLKLLFVIAVYSIFVQNFVLARFLGLCPYIGVSKKMSSAVGMGFAVIFVMTLASAVTWLVYTYFLDPATSLFGYFSQNGTAPDLTFLRTIAFILVIASLVQFIEMFIQKMSPALYKALGIYLPLITTNCAVLGAAVLNIDGNATIGIDRSFTFIESIVQGFSAGIGFLIVLILMAGLREKLELKEIPESLKGVPIAFITAGLMAIAFLGFSGLSL
ncbi:RnfABCDGE type electron transport complex subunit A [bacterium]|nr:RnfABCDGE type electron transport complex subunit A [bacterium]